MPKKKKGRKGNVPEGEGVSTTDMGSIDARETTQQNMALSAVHTPNMISTPSQAEPNLTSENPCSEASAASGESGQLSSLVSWTADCARKDAKEPREPSDAFPNEAQKSRQQMQDATIKLLSHLASPSFFSDGAIASGATVLTRCSQLPSVVTWTVACTSKGCVQSLAQYQGREYVDDISALAQDSQPIKQREQKCVDLRASRLREAVAHLRKRRTVIKSQESQGSTEQSHHENFFTTFD